jgi:prepilin-type N-terminal cleavage/methylation domain-containing protein
MNDRGYSLIEIMVAVAILAITFASAAPAIHAYSVDAQLRGAANEFRGCFRRAHSIAVRRNAYTAIRFEAGADAMYYSLYSDGNRNGVSSAEIAHGIDMRLEGPYLLTSGARDVKVAILPGTPAIPPDHGVLDVADPIRFGRSNMVSFSPLGTATPGTFYLAGVGAQAAVRVSPGSARVRLFICRGGRWSER